jgi:hypothetical protein
MKNMIMTLAAALTLGSGIAATAVNAQPHDRTVVRTTHTTVVHRTATRGHHRVCRVTWRHHQRVRTCRNG